MRTLAEIAPLRSEDCRAAADAVSLIAAREPGADPAATAHVATCLRCQAEVAAYRRVLRVMRDMRADVVPIPGWPAPFRSVTFALDGSPTEAPLTRAVRAACMGGLTAAGAAGVLVWLGRRRPGLPRAV